MIDELLSSYGNTLDLIRRAVRGLGPEELTAQPPGAPNHPAWTVGHLVHSAEAIGGDLGVQPWLPGDWAAKFGTGSRPQPAPSVYPPFEELMSHLDDAQERVRGRLRALPADAMSGPLPDVRHRAAFPTLGHATLHILSAHTAFHAGQLMLWRRAMDLPTEAAL